MREGGMTVIEGLTAAAGVAGVEAGGTAAAAGGVGGAATCCGVGAMVMVRRSLEKLAISGTVPLTLISETPLVSEYVADGIKGSLKVKVALPGGTSGSRLKVMRRRPGSVPMVGFTGEVKVMTRRGGVVRLSCAVKWVAMFPTKRRREAGLKATALPRIRGRM